MGDTCCHFCSKAVCTSTTSWPHSRKMKGILFPELPMMISSVKALHSYPSMSIFKITHFASIVAWGEKFDEFEMRRANIG